MCSIATQSQKSAEPLAKGVVCGDCWPHVEKYRLRNGYATASIDAGYAAGRACPKELIDRLTMTLPSQNARVEAILARGGARAQEAIYKLADGTSEDSSGDEWAPVKRVARTPRRA